MRAVAVFVVALALAGCVAPIDPGPTVAQLSDATKSTRAAMQEYDRDLVAYRNAQIRTRALEVPIRVQAARGTCVEGGVSCRVVVPLADGSLSELAVGSALGKTLEALDEIVLYMETLGGLAAAETDADLAAMADRAANSVAALASLAQVAIPGAGAIAPFAPAVGRAVAWVAGQAREQAKLVALRDASAAMQTVLAPASTFFADIADAAHALKAVPARTAALAALGRFNESGGEANLAALVKALAAADALAAAKPGQLFLDLNDAHKAFADALAAPVFGRENVRLAIAKVRAEAGRMTQLVKALRDAASQS